MVSRISMEDVWMNGHGFPLATAPSARSHPCPSKNLSKPATLAQLGARLGGGNRQGVRNLA